MKLDIQNIPIYNNINLENNDILITKIPIEKIENTINDILDKYKEICKYYINTTEYYWSVSFNVDIDQIEEMCKTAFEIKVFKGSLNTSIIEITKEIKGNIYWNELDRELIKLKIN
jgi:hypothetical protein